MSCRSAGLIDNFLEQSKFDALSSKVASSSFYNTTSVFDTKDALWEEAYTAVFDRLKEINMYQFHYAESVKLFGYKDIDLKAFSEENIERLLSKNLIEKKLIKPIYFS